MEHAIAGTGSLLLIGVIVTLIAGLVFGDGNNEEKLTESLQNKYEDAHLIHSLNTARHIVIKEDGTVILAITPNIWDTDIEREELIGKIELVK
jgi:hypothetical protein